MPLPLISSIPIMGLAEIRKCFEHFQILEQHFESRLHFSQKTENASASKELVFVRGILVLIVV